jgi:hypothetical protein
MNPEKAPRTTKRPPLRRLAWEQISEPGAYVELATGVLYRVPQETLAGGASPLVEKQGLEGAQPVRAGARPSCDSQFVQISGNPHIFSLGARMICVEHDIQPRF